MRSHLCNRCGSCVGLSEGAVVFEHRTANYRPGIVKPVNDLLAERMWNACAGHSFNFPEFNQKIYGDNSNFNQFTGVYKNIYIGNTTDEIVRQNSASGGILSQILIWLLENNRIDGAVVLGMSKTEPWLTQPFIATSKKEILEAAQSKYIISSVNELLPETEKFNGRLAYVGLPGQVQSIRKLQNMDDPTVKNIHYIFGPFYGNTLHFSSVKSFLKSYKLKDYTQITRLYFRYGEWPGNMRVELKSGRVIELPKFHANYLIPFHIVKNSLLCTDLSNEFTDISGGDAWAPVYEERGKGFSMVISRSASGQKIIDEMIADGTLELNPISEDEAITMHSHGYDLKKRGTFIRMRFRKWAGLKNPDFGYTITGFTFSRYLMEVVINLMFLVLGTSLSRFLIEQLPPSFVGGIFEKTRTIWKKSTYKIKRKKLNE
ncbi:MAG: Coenzyme F420 hydrogenase/dehydrogenase, beta subunit C-terminal domain [Bacteroidales bacterium]|nr:Coenzyme F420 hydrogenase/dehydrogenase, beta subunit C-terminal domain [Bacteroidales bacterium]MCF8402500.1 Coenzyme F420 hydrogenase/dehydrogenase, beta subunit C-terminal domain [Bacteroidales bacterium]